MGAASHPTKQVPAIYHHSLGDLTITAVNDGCLPFSFDYATHINPPEASKLYAASFRTDPPRVTVNAFAIRTPRGVVLIDSGCGNAAGDTLGNVPANLGAAGINPSDVTIILMTHLHIDHAGGLIDAAGNARYPNARLKILDMAASERLLVAGMHLDFPPFGHMQKQDQAYAFVPLVWSPAP